MRNAYIPNHDLSEIDRYFAFLGDLSTEGEVLPVEQALGRVLKSAVYAALCDPSYNAAAMDGIAVSAEATKSATERAPLILKRPDFCYVNTGNPVPDPFDAVVMIEDVGVLDDDSVRLTAPAAPWQHVRVKGESIVQGEMILPSRRRLRPVDVAAIFAGGNKTVEVYRKPLVSIITTGDEMVDDPALIGTGKLMESNSRLFGALIETCGGTPRRYPTVKDDPDALRAVLLQALADCDVVLVNAGSSAGTKDYARSVIGSVGEVFLHGLAAKPGKPTILARAAHKPVVGIPGYPVSAYIAFDLVVRPLLAAMTGGVPDDRPSVDATLTRSVVSSLKNTEFVRVSLGKVNGKLVATPLERGAAQIMSLVKADGILTVDRYSEGVPGGTVVPVLLQKPLSVIENNLVVIGSHDLIIDVIGEALPVTSAHVGSMGGILALQKGECHIAPIHLLDAASGTYNLEAVRTYFPDRKMALIKGVGRTQGLMLPAGNPKGVASLADLAAGTLRFANRQRGSGTRILTDYLLAEEGIDPDRIPGYGKEFATHLAVGMAVESGNADVGMGVGSAANCLGLDFIPLFSEAYDFLLDAALLDDPRVKALIELLKSTAFRQKLLSFGDYTTPHTGEVVLC